MSTEISQIHICLDCVDCWSCLGGDRQPTQIGSAANSETICSVLILVGGQSTANSEQTLSELAADPIWVGCWLTPPRINTVQILSELAADPIWVGCRLTPLPSPPSPPTTYLSWLSIDSPSPYRFQVSYLNLIRFNVHVSSESLCLLSFWRSSDAVIYIYLYGPDSPSHSGLIIYIYTSASSSGPTPPSSDSCVTIVAQYLSLFGHISPIRI